MSSRQLSTTSSSSLAALSATLQSHDIISNPPPPPEPVKAWVDPASLPHHGHASYIGGNAPDYVKQLNYNTFMTYGVGEEGSFGFKVGKSVKFTDVNVNRKMERQGRLEATTTAEIEVTKHMLNGAGMLHGGCVAYLIDK
ncbi:hypothetical protein JR316_0013374 [Psilocybe cubensis]|uniref:Uncharacterized protein n=1 Tax=Psilocybe cubensis TaxID=181762 RepID=A0ACB8GGX8_PSICU|nr:hypothetical protein JR316_0013374 [Psilocybe cubensis]KAH9474906.1 hypothetical protein JR316_0013374 [Psilocybe cubensis]